MVDLAVLLTDLRAESEDVDRMVAGLDADGWRTPTPAEGWTVAHQISHLAWTDRAAIDAITDPAAFDELMARAMGNIDGIVDEGAREGLTETPAELLTRWRAGRQTLSEALKALPAGTRLRWFGPPMAPGTMVTARIMETWAHGEDIAEALDVPRARTARLRHVAHLGVKARPMGFMARGLDVPADEVRVELTAPDGALWTWGPEDAPDRVTGPALDFCFLVTRRRHRADLAVKATGPAADAWLDVAQSFAGPPGADPVPQRGAR